MQSRCREYLQTHSNEMASQLCALVNMDTPTGHKSGLNRQTDLLASWFGQAGGGVERVAQTEHGDHLRIEWGEGAEQALILCHMDTVWPVGTAAQRPWRSDRGKGYGPGCFDMKGGIIVGLWALKALAAAGVRPHWRLVYILNADEEMNSPTSRPMIEREARQSAMALVLEPSPNGVLVTSRKGGGPFHVKITGRPAHSGANHALGISAIEEMARQIIALHSMTDYSLGTTLNVGVVRGGTAYNVVAEQAEADVDLRVTSQAEGERMMSVLFGLQPHLRGNKIKVTGAMTRTPWEPSERTERLFRAVRDMGRQMGLELTGAPSGGGSDGCITAALGTPTLDGLGVVGFGSHALDEWVDLESLAARAELLARFLTSRAG